MPTYAKPDLGDKGPRPVNGTHYVYSYQHSRVHQHVESMKELFQDIHIDNIMTFLRQINLFNKI